MRNANNFVNTWGGKLYFIYLPDKERYSNMNIKGDRYLKRSQVIELINKQDNVECYIIEIDKNNEILEYESENFDKFIAF